MNTKYRVIFNAFYWDNPQGGSGKWMEHVEYFEVPWSCSYAWESIHEQIQELLKLKRPFDQSMNSKNQSEYVVLKAELV